MMMVKRERDKVTEARERENERTRRTARARVRERESVCVCVRESIKEEKWTTWPASTGCDPRSAAILNLAQVVNLQKG